MNDDTQTHDDAQVTGDDLAGATGAQMPDATEAPEAGEANDDAQAAA